MVTTAMQFEEASSSREAGIRAASSSSHGALAEARDGKMRAERNAPPPSTNIVAAMMTSVDVVHSGAVKSLLRKDTD